MLIPTKENIRKIFETHQNQCAFSNCRKEILDSEGHINGNILFLESNNKDRPRFNPDLTNEQMIDYHNLILVCWEHVFDVQWRDKENTVSRLRNEIFQDLQTLNDEKYNLPNGAMHELLFHFIEYHDPDTHSHVSITTTPSAFTFGAPRHTTHVDDVHIDPTKQFAGGKFEIIDISTKLNPFDKVIFYAKSSTYSQGIQAETETKSTMNIVGKVPELPKGEYFVSVRSAVDDLPRTEKDLLFTIL